MWIGARREGGLGEPAVQHVPCRLQAEPHNHQGEPRLELLSMCCTSAIAPYPQIAAGDNVVAAEEHHGRLLMVRPRCEAGRAGGIVAVFSCRQLERCLPGPSVLAVERVGAEPHPPDLSKMSVRYAKISQNMPKIWSNLPKFQSEFSTSTPSVSAEMWITLT